jgi:SAM-dependent methyltransferase
MKAHAYQNLASQEDRHWFYAARRRAVESLLRRHVLPGCPSPEFLDVGCGTGGTSAWLTGFGKVVGVEPSPIALELLKNRYPTMEVVAGRVGDLPTLFPPASFDVVTALGVLYHRDVDDPQAALDDIARTLRDPGWLIWSDCVYPCLRRGHDELVECGRRFYPQQMHHFLRNSGLEVVYSSHFLGWGFPIALVLAGVHRGKRRFARRDAGDVASRLPLRGDDRPLPSWLNAALAGCTYWEWRAGLWGAKMPLGVTRLILARKSARCPASAVGSGQVRQRAANHETATVDRCP